MKIIIRKAEIVTDVEEDRLPYLNLRLMIYKDDVDKWKDFVYNEIEYATLIKGIKDGEISLNFVNKKDEDKYYGEKNDKDV